MKKIIIGDEQEYTKRLSDYLMRHMPSDVRIYTFSTAQHLLEDKNQADLYLFGEDFYEEFCKLGGDLKDSDICILSKEPGKQGFCRMDSPARLVSLLLQRLSMTQNKQMSEDKAHRLIAVYAPFSEMSLKDWVIPMMHPGDLYLGFEDVGEAIRQRTSARERNPLFSDGNNIIKMSKKVEAMAVKKTDMTELCYYIRLHEKDVMTHLDQMVCTQDGRFYVDSPPSFFDTLGLQEKDYRWFLEYLKAESVYTDIYIGLGAASIPSLEYFQIFQGLILLDQIRREKVHLFCDKLVDLLVSENYMEASMIERRWLS